MHLLKGTVIELEGRVYVTAYISTDGEAKASQKCHVHRIKIHGGGKKNSVPTEDNSQNTVISSDLEFIDEAAPF